MDGGQKIKINLESPLDTKSSDMMVSVQDPRFAHNRQRYQGHVLPTSLRFEHDGWAAGWYVYQFDFEGGYIYSDKSTSTTCPYMAASRVKINNFPTYVISFRPADRDAITGAWSVDKAKEFQIWFNDKYEFLQHTDVTVNNMTSDGKYTNISLSYNNQVGSFQFENMTTEIVSDSDALVMDFENINGAGRVTAMLTDTATNWEDSFDVAVPASATGLEFTGVNTKYDESVYVWTVDGLTGTEIYGRAGSDKSYRSNVSFSWADWQTQAYVNATLTFTLSVPATYSYISGNPILTSSEPYINQISTKPYSDNPEENTVQSRGYYCNSVVVAVNTTKDSVPFYSADTTPVSYETFSFYSHAVGGYYYENDTVPDVYFKSSAFVASGYVKAGSFIQKHATWFDGKDRTILVDVGIQLNNYTFAEDSSGLGGDRVLQGVPTSNLVESNLSGIDWSTSDNLRRIILYPGIKETVSRDSSNTVTSAGLAIAWDTPKASYYYFNMQHARVYVELDLKSILGINVENDVNHWLAGYFFTPVFMDPGYQVPVETTSGTSYVIKYGGTVKIPAGSTMSIAIWDYDTGELLVEPNFIDQSADNARLAGIVTNDSSWHAMIEFPETPANWRFNTRYYSAGTGANSSLDNKIVSTRVAADGLSITYDGAHYSSTNDSNAFCNVLMSVVGYMPYVGQRGAELSYSTLPDSSRYTPLPRMTTLDASASSIVTLLHHVLTGTGDLYYVPKPLTQQATAKYTTKLITYLQKASDFSDMFGTQTTASLGSESDSETSYTYKKVDVSVSAGSAQITYRTAGHYFMACDEDGNFTREWTDSYEVPFVKTELSLNSIDVPSEAVTSYFSAPLYAKKQLSYTADADVQVRSADLSTLKSNLNAAEFEVAVSSTDTVEVKTFAANVNTPVLVYYSSTKEYEVTTEVDWRVPDLDEAYAQQESWVPSYNNANYKTVTQPVTYSSDSPTESTEEELTLSQSYPVGIDMDSFFGEQLPPVNMLLSYDISAQTVTYNDATSSLTYNYATATYSMKIMGLDVEDETVNITAKELDASCKNFLYNNLAWNQYLRTRVYFKPKGPYKYLTYDDTVWHTYSVTGNDYTFSLNGYRGGDPYGDKDNPVDFTFHFDDFASADPAKLVYKCTDTRDSSVTKELGTIITKDEMQVVKQLWDPTVATENFWWLDDQYVLSLTKSAFVLSKKDDGNLDDWNGDIWTQEKTWYRGDFIPSDVTQFMVTSAKDSTGLLLTFVAMDEATLRINVYDPLSSTDMLEQSEYYDIEINRVAIGSMLNVDKYKLNSYSEFTASTLLAEARISATHIDGRIIIGIQYDRNMCQWAIIISNNSYSIIQGYGCVGVDGSLTGGMIPAEYFDSTYGFTGTVKHLKTLEAEDKDDATLAEFNAFETRIVGDENQQWYICKQLTGIVSHLKYTNGSFAVNTLPLSNNYAQVYKSPSFIKYMAYDFLLQTKTLLSLFGSVTNTIITQIVSAISGGTIYFISPYTNIANYLQQTLGQYAYVHYNSTSRGRQGNKAYKEQTLDNAGLDIETASNDFHVDPVTQDDLSFDVLHISQEQDFGDSTWADMLGILGRVFVSSLDMTVSPTSVNTMQNQSAVSDIGKKFSQAFLQNINSMSVTGFNQQSTTPALKSEVTAVKTLDMFYSTSADQKCFAGPGYVNHQFVAQCTAQSVTSVQAEAQQTQVYLMLKSVTLWTHKLNIALWKALEDVALQGIQAQGGTPFLLAGVASGTSYGWLVSLILSVAWGASVIGHRTAVVAEKVVSELLDDLLPNGVQVNITAKVSRHNYDIEGKHAYGSKSECFMWPCYDCKSATYTDETVEATTQNKPWPMKFPSVEGTTLYKTILNSKPGTATESTPSGFSQDIDYFIASCKGTQSVKNLPADMAYVIGAESFMPTVAFKNENIGESEPVFTIPPIQDYILDNEWNLSMTCTEGKMLWVSCKDTKLFDGPYSNVIVTDSFCGIAAPHIAVEVKREISQDYTRPYAVSPDVIAVNMTGLNVAYEEKIYHAFDGYGYRIVDWLGSAGMNKEHYTWQYCFQKNDRFKRSTKLPPNQFLGNFQSSPSMSVDIHDDLYNEIAVVSNGKGVQAVVAGEDRDQQRYSIPVFTEIVSSLPTIVKSLSPYKLAVFDGITSLTTDSRTILSEYKLPVSVDFTINTVIYRMTNEYICTVEHVGPSEVVTPIVPALGLTFLGASPYAAYLYNQATRQYFVYTGGMNLKAMEMLERFRDIKSGLYDFINQDVTMPCLATFDRLDSEVQDDDDETDNIIVPVFNNGVAAREVTPPVTTIFNTRSWFKTVALPAGVCYQGPNRCIINRYVWSEYMLDDIVNNKGKWVRVPRETYHPFRDYRTSYSNISTNVETELSGWTHNPFLLVTAPLGVAEEVDCMFEWEITFAWTVEMEKIIAENEYVTVNVAAETMTPGGKLVARPTHIFLTKELFARSGNFGYYSFRYQSKNGAGNRERLHIWSDGYIAISGLQLEYKPITEKRNEILTQQADVKGYKEM